MKAAVEAVAVIEEVVADITEAVVMEMAAIVEITEAVAEEIEVAVDVVSVEVTAVVAKATFSNNNNLIIQDKARKVKSSIRINSASCQTKVINNGKIKIRAKTKLEGKA